MRRMLLTALTATTTAWLGCGGTTANPPPEEGDSAGTQPVDSTRPEQTTPGLTDLPEEVQEEACAMQGAWAGQIQGGPFAGETMRLVVDAEGAVTASAGPNVANQSWSLYEDILSVQHRSDTIWTGVCDAEESATYEVNMAQQCTVMRLVAKNEPCDARRQTMDGLELALE